MMIPKKHDIESDFSLLGEELGFKVSGFSVRVSATRIPGPHMRIREAEKGTAEPQNIEGWNRCAPSLNQ
jgi:hypothetical protein